MNFCTNCGAGLGLGRFCTNCGAPVSSAVEPVADQTPPLDTDSGPDLRPFEESPAERTVVRMPAVQPDASRGSRYPLFADELPTHAAGSGDNVDAQGFGAIPPWTPSADPTASGSPDPGTGPLAAGAALGGGVGAAPAPPAETSPDRARGSRAGWIVAAVLLLLLCAVSIGWLVSRDDGSEVADAGGSDSSGEAGGFGDGGVDMSGSDAPTASAPEGQPVNLAGTSTASGPEPVPPSTDFDGNRLSYPAANMLDDDPESAYRIDGDASGTSITLELPEEATIHEVGLVNGYAKTGTTADGKQIDWYAKNRRVLEVEWVFDDGTSVTQSLKKTTDLQTISVDGAVTETIELRLTEVSDPGRGKWRKDVTALSSVLLRGASD